MRRALPTLLVAAAAAIPLALPGAASAAAVDGDGMWIWYVNRSSGGTPDGIAAKARRHGVETVIIKAADARDRWRQFNGPFVAALKARGLKVCGYQFVYGRYPKTEAERGAEIARAGADCLLIDAETHYEGKYSAAQRYMRRLRSRVGPNYELALTSFPYVHYHPAFPYSVFLGPNGAQRNLPQMYWKAIGVSPDRIFRVTYSYNAPYRRPIYPLGQTYSNPSSRQVLRFRKLATAYGASGVSWWVWQFSRNRQWTALGSPFEPIGLPRRRDRLPVLRRGNRSDLVVWAQQHLMKAGLLRVVTGRFGGGTARAVRTFQFQRGLPVTGRIGPRTWGRLLPVGPAAVRWRGRRARAVASVGGPPTMPEPLNARRPAVRNELRRKRGG